jgi:hypothetical protein
MTIAFRKAGIVALLLIVGAFVFAPSAHAANPLDALQNQIDGLLSKFQTEPVYLSTGCSVPAAPLALGSYGPEVKKLQVWLGQHGYPVVAAGKESQYFGPLTHFALIKFQSAAGIRPVSGFYGPITKAEISKRCAAEEAASLGLRVKLSDDSPEGAAVPHGSVRVEVLRINVSGKSTLNELTIHRIGAGHNSGFSQVYLFDGDVRLTSEYAFNKQTDMVTFTDLNLSINGTKTLSVMADISRANDFSPEGVEIISTESLSAEGVVTGSFPIRSELFSRSDKKVGKVSINRDGDLLDPRIGQQGVQVAKFRLVPDVSEEVSLRSIALTIDGTVDPSLVSNFILKQGGMTVARASAVNARNLIMLRFDEPLKLTLSSRPSFELFADLGATVEDGQTLGIYLGNTVDLYITGAGTDAGVPVDAAGYNNTSGSVVDGSWTTVRGGVVNYTFRGPSVANYAVKQQDVELMRFDVKAKSNVLMREMRLNLTAGGADASGTLMTVGGLCNLAKANYADVKLVDAKTGAILTRSLDTKCATGEQDSSRTLVFEDEWQVGAGQTRTVKVTADIGSFTPAAGETIKATLLAFERDDIRNLDTGNLLNDKEVLPAGNMTGATHRIHANEQVANLATTLASVLSDTPSASN